MIYIDGSPDFDDYTYFTWAMSVILEDFKAQRTLEFASSNSQLRPMLMEWLNKIEDSMLSYGYDVHYLRKARPLVNYDYRIWFTITGRDIPNNVNRVFKQPKT